MTVHVGGKRTHGRYLLLRQRVEVIFLTHNQLGISVTCIFLALKFRNSLVPRR